MRQNYAVLSRETILKTAVAFIDESGLETLSMRNLAKKLHVEAMSLYNHIANKEDLLNGIVETIADEVKFPEPTADWRLDIRRIANAFHAALLRHPHALPIISTHSLITEKGLVGVEKLLAVLGRADTSPISAFSLMHILLAYVIGHAWINTCENSNLDRPDEDPDGEKYPYLVPALGNMPCRDAEWEFQYGLNLILNGI
jgi:AcrR family transcriptional regulator